MFFDSIIFDFDYTLADGTDAIVACYNYAFSKMGYPDGEREAVRRTVGKTVRDSITELTGCHDPESVEKMRLLFREKADEILAKQTYLYKDTVPVLTALKEKGIRTAIVSSKEKVRIEESLSLGGGNELIELIIGVSSAPEPKPSPSGVNMAMKELSSKRALYVGDSLVDFETAKNAGLPFAAITTGTTTREDFLSANKTGEVRIFGIFESLTKLLESLLTERTLYVTDIDGTLKCEKGDIPSEKKEIINEAVSRGVLFTAATARGVNSAKKAVSGIEISAPLITLSGVESFDSKTGKIVRYPLDGETVKSLEEAAVPLSVDLFIYRAKKGDATLYITHKPLKSVAAKRFKERRNKVEGQIFIEENETVLPENEEFLYIVAIGAEKEISVLKCVTEEKGVLTERFSESGQDVCYLEVFSSFGGKGNAAKRVGEAVFADRIVAFGDNLNDIAFAEAADEFYAVKNALPEVKKHALGVIFEGAVADFIASREMITDKTELRPAKKEDVPFLAALEKAYFKEAYSEKLITEALESKSSFIAVATECGAISGYIMASVYGDFAEIDKILTLPACRKRGIAKRLHEELVKRARERGNEKILLEVRSKNSARAFYEALGYKTDGIRKNYYKDDDAVLMSFEIK